MDKYEYKIRANEIKELIECEEYAQAAEIADTIDWRRVKSVMMLCTISDLYKINRRYEDARDMLLLAYERRPGGRTICYSLCELSIKTGEYVQAIEYYKEYVQATSSPNDTGRFILQYKIYEANDASLEERIAVLEKLKQCEYLPKWGYELAYLYHRIGLASRCVEECDEMILWFGDGKYVVKAMELKMLHQPLTPSQQEKYDMFFYGAVQTEQPVESVQESYEEAVYEAPEQEAKSVEELQLTADTQIYPGVDAVSEEEPVQEAEEQPSEEMDIHVKTMDVGQYNTINLQAELAEGLREVLAQEQTPAIENSITRSIVAPMLESDTESLDYPEIDEVSVEDVDVTEEEMESSEVFFGETGEIGSIQQVQQAAPAEVQTEIPSVEQESPVTDATAELVMEQLRLENTGEIAIKPTVPILHVEPPKALAEVLSQESDGQLSLVMPEKESIEKQITGQISLDDILAEWERMKKENQEKREAQMRQHVMQQTGTMFTEFEASVRDGLLEQLERGKNLEETSEPEEQPAEVVEPEEQLADTEESEVVFTDEDAVEELEEIAEQTVDELVEEGLEEVLEKPVEEVPEEEIEEVIEDDAPYEELEFEAEEETEAVLEDETQEQPSVEERYKAAVQELSEETEGEPLTVEDNDLIYQQIAEREEQEVTSDNPPDSYDKAKARPLTREEKELFAPFIQTKAAREQLVRAIDGISLAACTGNVIITGEEGMDTLTLAKNMIRDIQATDSNFSGKVAKISGQALNKKDVAATLEQLKNGSLIISKASEMKGEAVSAMHKFLQKDSIGIVVVLEDTKKAMDKFLAQYDMLKSSFTARVDVEAMSNDMLVAFGKQYARELEYSIDDLGVLALHTRIDELQTIDHAVTVVEVKEIVDEAIKHANRKTLGHFFDILFAKRYDEEDMIILSEKDFV